VGDAGTSGLVRRVRSRTGVAIAAVTGAVLAVVGAGLAGAGAVADGPAAAPEYGVRTQDLQVAGTPEPGPGGRATPVTLDATIYLPVGAPREPAVLLAHGFSGSKRELDAQARELAGRGYVALAYTARGFGFSGGLIHLDAPAFEIADGSRLLDVLAARPEVLLDGPGDPRVGVVGGSYGGALALLLAGQDRRVDAIVPQITWNDLGQALFPQFEQRPGAAQRTPAGTDRVTAPGVFKKAWAAMFFTSRSPDAADRARQASACGRFVADLCEAYRQVATTGRPTPALYDLLQASSPARVLNKITAPTLLVQGEADSLFPLSEADANARGIAANGTPVKVVWYSGGHDGGSGTDAEVQRITDLSHAWLSRYLTRDGSATDTAFDVTVPGAAVSSAGGRAVSRIRSALGYPGVSAPPVTFRSVPLAPPPGRPETQTVEAPPGAVPAALTSVPGLGGVLTGVAAGAAGNDLSAVPGQTAVFESAPLDREAKVVGGSRITLRVAGLGTDATLFAQLYDVDPAGGAVLPAQLVSSVYLPTTDPAGRQVAVALPAVVRDVPAGHRLRLVVSTTDQAYAMPSSARQYAVATAPGSAGELAVPDVPMRAVAGDGVGGLWPWALAVLLAAVAGVVGLALARRRRRGGPPDPALADVPLAVEGLGKTYGDGFRAVSDLTFRVEPGWVLGLLGPNGAGKTTVLRMLMGLIRPNEGGIRVFGYPVSAGSPVLSRVGAFVEGPGFLPHVSGLRNLQLFWAATGRPAADAHLAEALEIAGLGDDVHRRVKTYSQGMRQRLAIAQAMLGLPDLLVLDEPTNGLDPPQIREMREVLSRYAATGRTVVVSSHLLAEVEQTCTHVVVMHQGRLVAEGPVAELVGSATVLVVDVDDPALAAKVAGGVPGTQEVTVTPTGVTLKLVGTPRGDLVRALVEAGLAIEKVAPQRGLEEAFLALVGEG
jgi:ABC-2 type transport system ATP-binding protein